MGATWAVRRRTVVASAGRICTASFGERGADGAVDGAIGRRAAGARAIAIAECSPSRGAAPPASAGVCARRNGTPGARNAPCPASS